MKKAVRHDNIPYPALKRANDSPLNVIPEIILEDEKSQGLKRLYPATQEQEHKIMDVVAKLWDVVNVSSGSFTFPIAGVFLYNRMECSGDYADKDVIPVMAFIDSGSPRGFIGLDVHALSVNSEYIAFLLCTGVACCAMGGELESPVTAKALQYYIVEYDKAYSTNVKQFFDEAAMLP